MIIEWKGKVKVSTGITPAVATRLIQDLQKITGDMMIKNEHYTVDAKSILGLVSIHLRQDEAITFLADTHEFSINQLTRILEKYFDFDKANVY